VVVRGRGRRRTVLFRLEVNATATVRANLARGGRRVATRRWRVRAGRPLLRLRVPARARPGRYLLGITIRPRTGRSTHVVRRLRVRR